MLKSIVHKILKKVTMKKTYPTISISSDNMKAIIELPIGSNTKVTPESINLALEEAEVRIPVPEEIIQKIVLLHNSGKDISGVAIVQGTPPRVAVPGEIIPSGNLDFPVFPGDQFGQLKPAIAAKNGINVKGQLLPPPASEKSVDHLRLSPNETVVEAKGELVAMRYGLVNVEDHEISITPLITLSADLMELHAKIYPMDFLGQKVTVNKICSALRAMGLRARPNLAILEEALEQASKTGEPVSDVVICRGLKPFQGEDGWLEIMVESQTQQPGSIDKSGNIDYKNRGTIQTVKKGDVVAHVHAPGKGRPGRNLLGSTIEGNDGTPCHVSLGENVAYAPNSSDIIAQVDGLFSFINNEISISEVFVVNGDVGLRTGHIAMERGSIQINGSVLSGFHVACPGSIFINGTVEDAILIAGGDIYVNGGLMMHSSGFIRASGSVRALFAISSRIHAGTNVHIINEVNKSTIVAEGNILVAGGKGKVVGGLLHSGKSIEINQLGSEMGAATTVRLGIDDSFLDEYQSEQVRLTKSLNFILEKLGSGEDEEIIARYPEDKLSTVKHILSIRTQLTNRVKELDTCIVRLKEQMKTSDNYILKVHGFIYSGVTVVCQDLSLPVHSPLKYSKIVFDTVKRQFSVSGL